MTISLAKERILGFYSTGPRLREADLDISDLLSNYAESPLLLICEVQVQLHAFSLTKYTALDCLMHTACMTHDIACVQPKEMGLPTTAYYPKEEIREV